MKKTVDSFVAIFWTIRHCIQFWTFVHMWLFHCIFPDNFCINHRYIEKEKKKKNDDSIYINISNNSWKSLQNKFKFSLWIQIQKTLTHKCLFKIFVKVEHLLFVHPQSISKFTQSVFPCGLQLDILERTSDSVFKVCSSTFHKFSDFCF